MSAYDNWKTTNEYEDTRDDGFTEQREYGEAIGPICYHYCMECSKDDGDESSDPVWEHEAYGRDGRESYALDCPCNPETHLCTKHLEEYEFGNQYNRVYWTAPVLDVIDYAPNGLSLDGSNRNM